MTENRRESLRNFLRSLEREERAWLARKLLGEFRSDVAPRENMRENLFSAELWLRKRIESGKNGPLRLSRIRLWLIFMLLRYGGLRPAEIFALSPDNLTLEEGVVRIGGEAPRVIPLPLSVAGKMRRMLCGFPVGVGFFRCDPSQVRRSLRQCAKACGLTTGMLSPTNLRKNRAIELELLGLPYALINLFMGRASRGAALATGFENPLQILKTHIQEEHVVKTSARNVFQGKVSKIRQHGILAGITVETASGLNVVSMITETSREKMALVEGKLINALVKAPFVSVVPVEDRAAAAASADNCFRGVVEEARSDNLAEEIIVRLPQGNAICALYAMGTRPDGAVAKGGEVLVCFSSFSVILTEE